MTKTRANLYLDKELYERAKTVLKALPGDETVSTWVNKFLAQMVPISELALEAAKGGDAEVVLALLDSQMGDMLSMVGTELHSVRTNLKNRPKKEEPS